MSDVSREIHMRRSFSTIFTTFRWHWQTAYVRDICTCTWHLPYRRTSLVWHIGEDTVFYCIIVV